jgi:hypothetical protein
MPKRVGVPLTKRAIEAAQPGTMLWDIGLPGFGLRVTPAGARTFIVQYRAAGGAQGRRALGAFPAISIEAARAQARPILAQAKAGRRDAARGKTVAAAPTTTPASSPEPDVVRHARRVLAAVLEDIGRRKASGDLEGMMRDFPAIFAAVAGAPQPPPPARSEYDQERLAAAALDQVLALSRTLTDPEARRRLWTKSSAVTAALAPAWAAR